MTTRMLAALEKAIDKVIEDCADGDSWSEMIHDDLPRQMAKAAEMVFDSAQDGQKFLKQETAV